MEWNQIEGQWTQFTGSVKEKWGRLTDDELDVIAGRRDKFIGKLQEKYGLSKDEAEHQLEEWQRYIKI
jgi:uncharacterized protein YjbJ (UPF0337 family)